MSEEENVYVTNSPIHGKGLYARVRIKKGELIGTFEHKPAKRDGTYVLWLYDEDTLEEEGYRIINDMRFANHSSTPNAELENFDLYALKTIKPDDEICFVYGWDEEDEEAAA